MSRQRPRTRRAKNKRKRPLTPIQKNEILVLKEMGHTYPEICTKTQLGYGTVAGICQKGLQDSAEVKKIRGEALIRAARETFALGLSARDAITPESLVQERIEVLDDAGNLVDIKLRGSSPLQNATIFGIMTDKAEKLAARGEQLLDGTGPQLTPEHMGAILSTLKGKLSRISIDFDTTDVENRIEALQEQAVDATWEETGDEQ